MSGLDANGSDGHHQSEYPRLDSASPMLAASVCEVIQRLMSCAALSYAPKRGATGKPGSGTYFLGFVVT